MVDHTGETDTKILHLEFRCAVGASSLEPVSCAGKDVVDLKVEPEGAFDLSKVDYYYNTWSGINVLFLNWIEPKHFQVSGGPVFRCAVASL